MVILLGLLSAAPKSRKASSKKPRASRAVKRKPAAPRRGPHVEMTAAEVVREALLRG